MNESSSERLLREFLRERETRCPLCQYSLHNCEAQRCPECGTALELGLVEGHTAAVIWWAGAVAGLATTTLMSAALLIMLLSHVATTLHDPKILQLIGAGFAASTEAPNWWSIDVMAALTALAGALVTWLLAARRSFRRMRPRAQLAIGVTGLLSPVLLLMLLGVLMRYVL